MPCVSCGRRGYWIARSSQAMTRQVDRKLNPTNRGPVAQGIEHLPSKQRVEGSNPSGTANTLKPETGNPVTRASPQAAPRQSQAKPVYTTPIGCLNSSSSPLNPKVANAACDAGHLMESSIRRSLSHRTQSSELIGQGQPA